MNRPAFLNVDKLIAAVAAHRGEWYVCMIDHADLSRVDKCIGATPYVAVRLTDAGANYVEAWLASTSPLHWTEYKVLDAARAAERLRLWAYGRLEGDIVVASAWSHLLRVRGHGGAEAAAVDIGSAEHRTARQASGTRR